MEKDNFHHEQISNDAIIPEHILGLYKIDGHEKVDYESYLRSKSLFEAEVFHPDNEFEGQHSVLRTKNEILSQDREQTTPLIIAALQNNDIEIQRVGASLVQNAPENQRQGLEELVHRKIVEAIHNKDIQVQRIGINMVQFAPAEAMEDLREQVLNIIMDGLNSDDIDVQRVMAKKIDVAPEGTQDLLREIVFRKVVEALNGVDIRAQRLAAVMTQYAPSDKQDELRDLVRVKFDSAKQQGHFKEIVDPYLYTKVDENKDGTSVFSRDSFSKTGSETTLLLGQQFKNNLIIRHIEEPSFLAWKKAYESYSDWTDVGFDYVPIEPIFSFSRENHNNLVDVASGVLDLNLEEWKSFSGNAFKENLDTQKSKIIETLEKLGINHGHLTDANFCLRFVRDENGNPNLDTIPKIFLIDFDKAVL